MPPIAGTKLMNHQAPDRPVSCSRRQVTAKVGMTTARAKKKMTTYREYPMPFKSDARATEATMESTTSTRATATTHHQYSDRRARPENSKYLDRTLLTASESDMSEDPSVSA